MVNSIEISFKLSYLTRQKYYIVGLCCSNINVLHSRYYSFFFLLQTIINAQMQAAYSEPVPSLEIGRVAAQRASGIKSTIRCMAGLTLALVCVGC